MSGLDKFLYSIGVGDFIMERKRFTCKACGKRGNHDCEMRIVMVRGRTLKKFYAKCPHCLQEGEMRFVKKY